MEKFLEKFSDVGLLYKIIFLIITVLGLHIQFLSAYMGI